MQFITLSHAWHGLFSSPISHASLIGTMFPTPQVLWAMADDGLIFKYMAEINPKTKTPLPAALTSGFLAGEKGS